MLIPTQIRPHLTHGCAWKKEFASGFTERRGVFWQRGVPRNRCTVPGSTGWADLERKQKGGISMAQFASRTASREEEASAIANPAPLGLLTLALTTALIGASFARFLVPTVRVGIGTVAAPALVYGGVIQVLAGMWAFRKNHILAATLFSAYGGFLIAFGALFLPLFGLTTLFGANALAFNHALGLPFLCWTISCGVLVPGVLRTNMAQGAVVVCLCLSSLFLAIGELANANGPLLAIGGWVGIICALLAWNAALGGILQATGSPLQLPMGERGGASSTSARQYDGEPAV